MLSLLEHKGRKIYSSQRSRKSFWKELVLEHGVDFVCLETSEKVFLSEYLLSRLRRHTFQDTGKSLYLN